MRTTYSAAIKRALDLAVAVPALLVSLPVQGVVATLIAVKMGRPILFRQTRPGLHGQPFRLAKFRTMLVAPDATTELASDAARMTRFGTVLRSTSLDELPTLWNVIRGDMSVVGPRPLLMAYLPRYSSTQARRQDLRPGITGLAQISGRNSLSWDEKLALDVQYVEQQSLLLDLQILARTVRSVLGREGISAPGQATMGEFQGSAADGGMS